MNRLQKIGSYIIGGVTAIAFFGRQKISYGIKGIYLNGLITTEIIPLRIVGWLGNSTIASVLVRSISGVLVCNGYKIATIYQPINKRIRSNSFVEQSFAIDIHNQEALAALFENVNSGSVDNLAFDVIGEIVVGEQWPVSFKFNKLFTWKDIQGAL